MTQERKTPAASRNKAASTRRKFKAQKGAFRSDSSDSWHWAYTVMIAGVLFGVLSLGFGGKFTLVSILDLSKLVAICCVAGLVIPVGWYAHRIGVSKTEGFLLSVLGIGPILCGLLIWSNFLIRSDVRTERHRVVGMKFTQESLSGRTVLLALQDSAFKDWAELRRFEFNPQEPQLLTADSLYLTVGTGWLGYDIMIDREVVPLLKIRREE